MRREAQRNGTVGLGLAGGLALIAALVLWASAFVGIRVTVGVFGATNLALLRYLFASVILGAVAVARGVRLPPVAAVPQVLLHGFLGFTVYHVALNWGERTVSAGSAAFLVGAIPVFIAVFAFFLLGERMGFAGWLGMVVSMLGVALIAWGESSDDTRSFFDPGAVAVLCAALSEALYYVLVKPSLVRFGTLTYTTWTVWAGTLFLLAFTPGLYEVLPNAGLGDVAVVAYLGVGPGALAYLGWNFAISRGSVARLGLTQFALPGLTILLGWLLLAEMPGPVSLMGGVAALAGVAISRAKCKTGR